MKSLVKLLLPLALCAMAFPEDENVIVVSGAKVEEDINETSEKVRVVSAEEIAESGAKTLTDVMKSLPGVVVTGASPGNAVDSVSMQGKDRAYVKILVDGVAVSAALSGSVASFQIPVESIRAWKKGGSKLSALRLRRHGRRYKHHYKEARAVGQLQSDGLR